jgi:hypothetical protein
MHRRVTPSANPPYVLLEWRAAGVIDIDNFDSLSFERLRC